jgi:MoxR-like ATPase
MATAMLSALVPEAASIRESIRQAVEQADTDARDRNNEALTEAIETLTANFDETVRKLIVPTTIEIKRPGITEPVPIAGTVHEVFQEVLETLQARDHQGRPRNILLVGPAGCGKTTLAEQIAQALDVTDYSTPMVLSEHQVMGYEDAGGRYHPTAFRTAFEHGGVWLGDEMDSWSPEAALAANGALANGKTTFPDSPSPRRAHVDFYAIAAMNTWGKGGDREYVGRNEMDTATLSRFVTIPMDFDRALETALSAQWSEWRDLVWHVRDRSRELKVRMLAGTREMIHGLAMLNQGIDPDRVALRVLRRNMTDAEWAKVAA